MNDIRGDKDDADPNDDPDPNDRLTKIDRDPVERQSAVNETWASGKDSTFAYDVAGNAADAQDGRRDGDGGELHRGGCEDRRRSSTTRSTASSG